MTLAHAAELCATILIFDNIGPPLLGQGVALPGVTVAPSDATQMRKALTPSSQIRRCLPVLADVRRALCSFVVASMLFLPWLGFFSAFGSKYLSPELYARLDITQLPVRQFGV